MFMWTRHFVCSPDPLEVISELRPDLVIKGQGIQTERESRNSGIIFSTAVS